VGGDLIFPNVFPAVASTRRLAAIMFTDTVGYTTSTQTDEARTLELLRQQGDIVRPLISAHHGREVKFTGDGFLVEFDSALRATHCAVDIQRRIYERNAEGAVAPIQIRIGIHLGDVVQSGTDILGDAVNIAARIEPIAEPGGICLSGAVREQVWNKITDHLEKLPSRALKGLQVPLEVYRVVLPWAAKEPPSASSGPAGLAVLPLANISPDPKDEYFADGLTEELITVLSQLRELRVIARTSVMQYKSTSKSVSQIGGELGVSSILEGSVRKAGNRVRIAVQLIDAASQGHVWASTYDRELNDVFVVQTEIAKQVAEALKVELQAAEQVRIRARPAVRPDSYLAYLRGRTLLHTTTTRESAEAAKNQFELAIFLDSANAGAYAALADVTRGLGGWYATAPGTGWDETSRRLVARAVELDPNLAEARNSHALILLVDSEYAAAEKELKLALSLDPSNSRAHHLYAELLEDEARTDEALVEFALAEAADPLWPNNFYCQAFLLIWLGKLDQALGKVQKLGELQPDYPEYPFLLAGYYLARSDLEGCLKQLQRYEDAEQKPWWKPVIGALRCALSGEKEQARALLRHAESLPEFPGTKPAIVWVYCELGDLDQCFRWMEQGVPFQQIRLDPRLEPLRRDARFQVLLRKKNLA
jgi:adenylate cyclase